MSGPGDANQKPRMESDTAPLLVAREYMESIGMAQPDPVTEPLPKNTRPLMDPAMLKRSVETALIKANKLFTDTEARVELLVQSLQARKSAIPGTAEWPMKHPVSANGKNIITYLAKRYAHVPQLEKDVQLACSRFWELGQALEACREVADSGGADEAMLEDLKLKTYFVANFYDHFKEDPLLRQLYPPPAEPPKGRTQPIPTKDSITRYRQQRENALRRGEAHLKAMAPGVERVRHLMSLAKQDRGAALLGMLNPMDMRERQLVKRLREAKQLQKLDDLMVQIDKATAQLPRVRDGAPFEILDEAINSVIAMHAAWATVPGLNELLPPLP
ncbi:MAG: hypothetical protein JWM80_1969 [Cyanobacteria bacterium RYN_339]|nr:hypothetical protein [Cyanobacteria bacterium RYN_339]